MKHKPFFEVNMKKEVKLEILDDNHNGMGFSKYNNLPIFIDRTLKGDVVNVQIIKETKKYYLGKVISFDKKMKREKIICPYYDICGGCNLLHISYNDEIEKKKEYIERLFKREIKINSFERFNYRNKVTLHVKDKKLGLFETDSNTLVPIEFCNLLDKSLNDLIKIINSFDLSNIKEIILRTFNEKVLVKIIGKIKNDDLKKLISDKQVVSIYENDLLIYGDKYLKYDFNNRKYLVNQNSFFQVNTDCAISLYEKIKEYAGKGKSLLDLYCGALTIGIYLSDNFEKITGVEINKDSYNCALENIKLNSRDNCEIILGDSSLIKEKYDVVVVDPPRSGLSKNVISNLNNMKVKKIVYVSCNPSTLKRDIDLLENYSLAKMEIFNMFPSTKHVECVCLLTLK